ARRHWQRVPALEVVWCGWCWWDPGQRKRDLFVMTGALRSLAPPPIPNPEGVSLGVSRTPAPPMMGPAPAPTHKQTVAALRHLDAITRKLEEAARDPDLGRANLKSKIIDGMTSLVSTRLMEPGEAVQTLTTFPERPFDQKTWVMNHLVGALKA